MFWNTIKFIFVNFCGYKNRRFWPNLGADSGVQFRPKNGVGSFSSYFSYVLQKNRKFLLFAFSTHFSFIFQYQKLRTAPFRRFSLVFLKTRNSSNLTLFYRKTPFRRISPGKLLINAFLQKTLFRRISPKNLLFNWFFQKNLFDAFLNKNNFNAFPYQKHFSSTSQTKNIFRRLSSLKNFVEALLPPTQTNWLFSDAKIETLI